MGRNFKIFVFAVLVFSLLVPENTKPALAQETAVKKAPVKSNRVSDDLFEAQKRITRLETQIIEMQAMIGALQSLVKQRVTNLPQGRIAPDAVLDAGKTQTQHYQTQGWTANERPAGEPENSWLTDDGTVPGERPQTNARLKVNGAPRKLYDAGYNYLISNDYASAETTFKSFLRNYPQDELSGNVQYWLGETFFARGDYRQAANEFLKGYKTYKQSQKGPDNLLKLGMSLHRLGQSEAACQTYAELKSKYKNLPGHVLRHLTRESQAATC